MGFIKFELGPVVTSKINDIRFLSYKSNIHKNLERLRAYTKSKKNTLCLMVSECMLLQKRNTKQKYLTKELDYVMLFKYC